MFTNKALNKTERKHSDHYGREKRNVDETNFACLFNFYEPQAISDFVFHSRWRVRLSIFGSFQNSATDMPIMEWIEKRRVGQRTLCYGQLLSATEQGEEGGFGRDQTSLHGRIRDRCVQCIRPVFNTTTSVEWNRGWVLTVTSPHSAGWGITDRMLDDVCVHIRAATASPGFFQDGDYDPGTVSHSRSSCYNRRRGTKGTHSRIPTSQPKLPSGRTPHRNCMLQLQQSGLT